MKNISLTVVLLFSIICSSQEYITLKVSDSLPSIKEKGLAYISSKTDVNDFYYLATIKYENSDLNIILSLLQKSALNYQANAFKLKEHSKTDNLYTLIIDLYSGNENLINLNFQRYETNTIYFFGSDTKDVKFKINKDKIIVRSNDVYKYEVPKNEKTRINKGGFYGVTVYHEWKENSPVIFYSFDGLKFSGNGYNYNGHISASLTTGKLYLLKTNFALLLKEIKSSKTTNTPPY